MRSLLTHGCTRAQATVAFDNLPKEWAGIFPEHFSFTCCGIGFMLTLLLERVVLADGDDASGKKQNLKDSGRRFALNLTCIRLVCMCMYALYDQRAMHSRTHTRGDSTHIVGLGWLRLPARGLSRKATRW